jgi:hypothetical protein
MKNAPKYLHIARGRTAGMYSAVALCGRLVGRMSLVGPDEATCEKCQVEALVQADRVRA